MNLFLCEYVNSLNFNYSVNDNYRLVYYPEFPNKKRIVIIYNGYFNCSCYYSITYGVPCHHIITVFIKNNKNNYNLLLINNHWIEEKVVYSLDEFEYGLDNLKLMNIKKESIVKNDMMNLNIFESNNIIENIVKDDSEIKINSDDCDFNNNYSNIKNPITVKTKGRKAERKKNALSKTQKNINTKRKRNESDDDSAPKKELKIK